MNTSTAGTRKNSAAGNRYPGTDPQGWIVAGVSGKAVEVQVDKSFSKSFDGYASAAYAARIETERTGVHHGAVRV